jgi:hypothetical protein
MTSIEWFAQEINKINVSTEARLFINKLKEQAKLLHKQEIIKSNRDGVDMVVDKKPFIMGEQYYQVAFVSKGSEHIEQPLEEIISKAHTKITRRKGNEYAPTSDEIQKEIDATSSQMTSIEFIVKELKLEGYDHTIQQAQEMHYKELMDSMQKGMELQEKYNSRKGFRERNGLSEKPTIQTNSEIPNHIAGKSISKKYEEYQEWLNEVPEISDEEIEEAAPLGNPTLE